MYMDGMGLGWLDGMLIKGRRQSRSTFANKCYHFFQNFCIHVGSLQRDVIAIITKSVYNALFSSQLDWVEHRPFSKFLDISGEHQLRGKTIHKIEIQITYWPSSQGTDGSLFIEQSSSNCFCPHKDGNLPCICIFRQRKLTWLKTFHFLPISKELLKRVRIQATSIITVFVNSRRSLVL